MLNIAKGVSLVLAYLKKEGEKGTSLDYVKPIEIDCDQLVTQIIPCWTM